MTAKFIFENGVMKPNPAYLQEQKQKGTPSTIPHPDKALAVVSTPEDIMEAQKLQKEKTGLDKPLAPSTQCSMEIVMNPDMGFADKLQNPNVTGNDLLDGLHKFFARYEVPVGLINKALALSEYKFNFIVDDSGSMNEDTDALFEAACDYTRKQYDPHKSKAKQQMTRWQEAEDRLHTMVEMLAYIPTNGINISFLNRADKIVLSQTGKKPEDFLKEAHDAIHSRFIALPSGGTPIFASLNPALTQSQIPTMHFLLSDGVPTDCTIEKLVDLIKNRPNAQQNPLTLLSCTNVDSQVEWMKTVEEQGPYVAELDDYSDERDEVLKDQGPGLPYTRGFWLLCQLVAAINPDDLDAMDESRPFSKFTLDNLMGMTLTPQEYDKYFNQYPLAARFQSLKPQLMSEPRASKQILEAAGQPVFFAPQYGGSTFFSQPPAGQGYPNPNPSSYYQP